MTHYEAATARGIVLGGGVGTIFGILVFLVMAGQPSPIPPLVFIPGGMAVGAILGELWSSVSGLAPSEGHRPAR